MEFPDLNERFRDLFENTSDLIHFLSLDGNIEFVNGAWRNTMKYSFEEIKNKPIYNFIHPEYIENYKKYRSSVLKGEKLGSIEMKFIAKDGSGVLTEGQIGCYYKDKVPMSTRGMFKDITGKKDAEAKLEISEKRFRTFFKSAPEAVIVINQYDKILEWNPNAEKIFGYSIEETENKTLSDLIIPIQYRDSHRKGMQHFLKTGEGPVLNKTIEITALQKNGTEFFIELSISNAKINEEWIFIAFISDITKKKKIEEELVKQRAELLHSKYQEEKKDEFIGIASHELKTPLTSIKAFTQLALSIAEDECSDQIRNYLERIDAQAGRLNDLIRELLDVSKIQAGKLELQSNVLNFKNFLKSTIDNIQHITPTHTIQLHGEVNENISIDKLRIEQVIYNLVNNATKYSPDTNKIVVNAFIENGFVVVSVTDFGIGIVKTDLPKVFSRFFRVQNISSKFAGLGLGLYISAEIIKAHGGEMWVKSEEGKGSTFFFSLPLSLNQQKA